MSVPTQREPARPHRRRLLALGGGLLLLGLIVLVLLAIPFLGVRGDAEAANRELSAAMAALQDGDLETASSRVTSAREYVDGAREATEGAGGDVWSILPVAGTAVDDVRHLVAALDDATAVAEIGVDLYPSVAGKRATLFRDQRLDLDTLDRIITGVRQAGEHVLSAKESLDQVEGSTPLIGGTVAGRRDDAAERVNPMSEVYTELEPMLDDLPAAFGASGRRTYLVALLNPAELRYSGGATLSFAPLTWEEGGLELGESLDNNSLPRFGERIAWKRVFGNSFRREGRTLLANATFAPSWSVSGEELLRAWRKATGDQYDGVLAVDVVTLARLFGVSGSLTVPGYGELTEDNLVETLIGSYDQYYPDATVQDELNEAIIPAFQEQLFEGGKYFAKGQVLEEAADGRHFALYFREPDVQTGFTALGFAGDLAEPTSDYLGVFSQNVNGSKVDYWQRRSVSDEITLGPDGSARHRLEVVVRNDTPPYVAPVPDPGSGYFTRFAEMALTTFVPAGVDLEQASVNGRTWDGYVRGFRGDHDYLAQQLELEPGGRAQFSAEYRIPTAVEVDDGALTYQLAVDPQGMVNPQTLDLTVALPDGYRATTVPEGWTVDGTTLRLVVKRFDTTQTWEIVAEPSN